MCGHTKTDTTDGIETCQDCQCHRMVRAGGVPLGPWCSADEAPATFDHPAVREAAPYVPEDAVFSHHVVCDSHERAQQVLRDHEIAEAARHDAAARGFGPNTITTVTGWDRDGNPNAWQVETGSADS